jgi:hypothetical protein
MTELLGAVVGGGDPDALGGGTAEGDVAGGSGESEGLIVIAFEEAQLCAGTNATGFEELEQAAVAFVDSTDGVSGRGWGIGEEQEAAMAAAGGTFHLAQIAVRTDSAFAQLGEEFGFEVGGDGVLEALGFIVDLPPFHAEEFAQHAFNEMVAEGELAGDLAAGGGETDVAIALDADECVLFKAAHGHGDGGGGDFQPVSETRRDNGFAFTLGFEDRFEIVFFGDGDHLERLYDLG